MVNLGGLVPLGAIPIAVSHCLTGSKLAVKYGRTVYLSPAMYDLAKHEDSEGLEKLLSAIRFVEIPDMPRMFDTVPDDHQSARKNRTSR